MTRTFTIDNKTRFIVIYQDVTKKASRIHKLTGISLSTIYDWTNKIENDIDIFQCQEGRGAKPKITEDMEDELLDHADNFPQTSSTRRVAAVFDVSQTSVHNIYKENEYRYKGKKTNRKLSSVNKEARVKFCKEMLRNRRDGKRIRNTFYSDEMGFRLSECDDGKAWVGPGKKIKLSNPIEDVKLNLWAAVSPEGATDLYIFKENLNGNIYKDILAENLDQMDEILHQNYFFQQDNHKAHLAAVPWGEENGMNFVDFPSYSPDLNIIENVWATLKREVRADNPQSEEELRRSLIDNWNIITEPDKLAKYFESLERRYQECIDVEGEKLPY